MLCISKITVYGDIFSVLYYVILELTVVIMVKYSYFLLKKNNNNNNSSFVYDMIRQFYYDVTTPATMKSLPALP